MLAEELPVFDGDSPLWRAARPFLDAALLLEQNDDSYCWHGWNKRQINTFLASLPPACSLVAGVWDILVQEEQDGGAVERELLTLGIVCEVAAGEVVSIRTFNALTFASLKPVEQLEPGFGDAGELLRVVKTEVAPVAWALFTDRATWNEWIFADSEEGHVIDKGALLATFAQQGRCVLMGTQTIRHHHHD